MTVPLLRATGVVTRRGAVEVLHGVDLDVRAGEILAVIGPNGAGKSTLLGTIAGPDVKVDAVQNLHPAPPRDDARRAQ